MLELRLKAAFSKMTVYIDNLGALMLYIERTDLQAPHERRFHTKPDEIMPPALPVLYPDPLPNP